MRRTLRCNCLNAFEWRGAPIGSRYCRYTVCNECGEPVRIETDKEVMFGHPDLEDKDSTYTPAEIESELKAKIIRDKTSGEKPIHSEAVRIREQNRRKIENQRKIVRNFEILIIIMLAVALLIWHGIRH